MWAVISRLARPQFRVIGGVSTAVASAISSGDGAQCMPPRRASGNANLNNPPNRSAFNLIPGDPDRLLEDHFSIAADAPVVTAMPFLDWKMEPGPPPTATIPRSEVVSTLMLATRRPSLSDYSRMEELPFVSNEVLSSEANRWLGALASAKAFDEVYQRPKDWEEKAHSFSGRPFLLIRAWD